MKTNHQLASQIINILRERGLHITTVESCTGGGIMDAITNIPGASDVTRGARVTYSNEDKVQIGVPQETIDQHTVYSLEVASAMSQAGSRAVFHAEVSIGITGSISRVDPANDNSEPGVVYVAVYYHGEISARKFTFTEPEERWAVKERMIEAALLLTLSVLQDNRQ